MKKNSIVWGVLLVLLLGSCASRKDMVYLYEQEGGVQTEVNHSYEPKLQPDDILSIIVNSNSPELAGKFNPGLVAFQNTTEQRGAGIQRLQTYLIDKEGYIDFPVVGKIKLGGLTTPEARDTIKKAIETQVIDATINLRIMNFKVTVQGEVARPGTFDIESERITLLQALSKAGDLTIYGKRQDILLIREVDGKRTYNRIDITTADFIESEFYYLMQNDIVYVEPNKVRVNSSAVGPNLSFAVSAISLLTTIIVVILNNS